MPDLPDAEHRSQTRSQPGDVQIREAEELDSEEGMMALRIPIASTGEVRNKGDDPLTSRELEGMARQVNDLSTGVFPDHGGNNMIAGGVGGDYSQFEKLGYWSDGEIEGDRAEEGVEVLMATARMPDPETLPAATAEYRTALAILKEQAKRDIPIDASIGWREDEDFPGGVDLMEASIVGIPADPRTSTSQSSETAVLARAAVDAGADPSEFVRAVEAAVSGVESEREPTPEDARPFGPPGGDPSMWEDFDACVADVEDWDDIDDPEAFCAWAESQSDAAEAPDSESNDDMSDTDQPDDEPTDEQNESTDDQRMNAEEFRERMLDMQEQQTELLQGLAERMDGEDGEEPDEDEAMDEEEEDEADDQSADTEETQDAETDYEERLAELEDELSRVKAGEVDIDTPEPEETQDAEDEAEEQRDADTPTKAEKYGLHQ